MVDERNEDQYDEEGEYHFSDDQNFDADESETETEAPAPVAKQNILAKLMPYRRMIIGIVGFFVIIFTIYGFISPKTLPESEITEVATPPTAQPVPQQAAATTPAESPQPSSAMMALQQPSALPAVTQTPPPPVETAVIPAPSPTLMPAPAAAASDVSTTQLRSVVDRLSALEEQNAKLVNLLQTQVAQKMADYDAENNAAQEKVRTLNKRMANMEASLNKMAQLMKDGNMSSRGSSLTRSSDMSGMPMPRVQQPKITYTVQAIIPGRAWLKNDGGDTVTVAEGDILRDFGRIIKIDPYDGIVEIDTGSKIIALSYGASGD